ncbi:glycoside hydrolase family 79 protein [Daldinia bambusicola]|nr:glycoside hydrolase family 79 protein [Daldinia bambusicola]
MQLTKLVFISYHLFHAALAATDMAITLMPSTKPPPGTSLPVDPSFAGFGIEPSNLFSFLGAEEPNTLTLNLLGNLANYTGKPPHIRIGGNTQDYMVFQGSQTKWTWILNQTPDSIGKYKSNSMLIGQRYFDAANRLPKGTTVTWGLNLAYDEDDHIEQITTMAKLALSSCPNLTITSFEIGNEPDLYLQNGFRAGTWGGRAYTQQWLARADAIYKQVLQPSGIASNFFEAAATASTIGTDFQIADLMSFDISAGAAGSSGGGGSATPYLSGWNQHDYYYYIGVSGYPVSLERLTQLSTTEDQFAAWLGQVQQAQQTAFPYALREMGVVGPIGLAGVTDVFGAALWTLNFLLYTASLGVAAVGFHMTDNSNASAWSPIPMYGRPPHVRPLYYGVAAFDQVVGRQACAARVARYRIPRCPPAYDGFVRAYAVYRQEQLASVVVVNGKIANGSQERKGGIAVQLQLPPTAAGKTVYLAYLTNSGADATANTTWSGISFEQSGDGTPVRVSDDEYAVQVDAGGTASFMLRDSQAVVASIGGKLSGGSTASCLTVPGQSPGAGSPAKPAPPAGTTDSDDDSDKKSGAAETDTITAFTFTFALLLLATCLILASNF